MIRPALLLPLALAACIDPLTSRDTITQSAGDAMRTNAVIMTVDPQAHRADKVHIHADGRRVARAMEAHREGSSGDDAAAPDASQFLRRIPETVQNPLNPSGSK
ncbi:MAG: hypothetical protein AAF318_04695 [Pseudomonadota bacterium]